MPTFDVDELRAPADLRLYHAVVIEGSILVCVADRRNTGGVDTRSCRGLGRTTRRQEPSAGGVRPSGRPSRITVLVSRNGSRPSLPPSRPMPDCLKPPNAMPKSVRKSLWPTVPDRSSPATARARSTSFGEHRRVEPVDRVVRDPHRVLLVVRRDHREHRAEDLLAARSSSRCRRCRTRSARRSSRGRGPRAAATGRERRALVDALRDVAEHAVALALRHERPELRRLVERVADARLAEARRERLDELVVAAPS